MRVRDDKTNLSTVLDQCNQDASSIGGYPVFAVMADGGVLCPKCVRENRELIEKAALHPERRDTQWTIVGVDINYEDSEMLCANNGELILPAYGKDGLTGL